MSYLDRDFLDPLPDFDRERDFFEAADALLKVTKQIVKFHSEMAEKAETYLECVLERDFLATGLFDPAFGEGLRDFDPSLLGDPDFLPLPECADALLPLLDLAFSEFSLPLLDFTESLDFERLRDFLAGECGEGDMADSAAASFSKISKKNEIFKIFNF